MQIYVKGVWCMVKVGEENVVCVEKKKGEARYISRERGEKEALSLS